MSDRHISQIIEDENTVTVVAQDEDGHSWTSTRSHNGSSWDRDDVIERCTNDALNKS